MLLSADLPLPSNILIHGFINDEKGQKMSKSIGNVIDPYEMNDWLGNDALRLYLNGEAGVGKDISFGKKRFYELYTDQLANNYGNYVNRVITLCQKYDIASVQINPLLDDFSIWYKNYAKSMESFDTQSALQIPLTFLDTANKFLNESAPWKMDDEHARAQILGAALEYLYHTTILFIPFLPQATKNVLAWLGSSAKWDPAFRYTQTGFSLSKPDILFEKIEYTQEEVKEKALHLTIDADVVDYVVHTRIQIPSNSKKQSKPLQKYLAQSLESIDVKTLRDSSTLQAYYDHLENLGLSGQTPAGANLLNLFEKNGKLPNINRLVDIYNITSLSTGLSFGVHDASKLPDDVSITLANGWEPFDAMMGAKMPEVVKSETVLLGSDGRVYGRDVKQSEQSKVSEHTRDVLIYIQWNTKTSKEQLQKALDEVTHNLQTFIG